MIEQIHPGLYRITTPFDKTGTVFLYLLKGERVALIDTGVVDSAETVLQPALAEVGLRLSDVALVLTTHAHLDHAGGNAEVKRRSGARIHLHALDLPLARSVEAEVEFHTAPLRALEVPPEAIADRAAHVTRNVGEPAGVDVLLSEGDAIDLGTGIRLRVVHCPGHTPGHVAYFWESEGILFTADSIQGMGARPGGYPYYFDAPSYRRSLTKVSGLDVRMLCLGHAFQGGALVNHPVRRGNEVQAFIQASLGVADTIHQAVAEAVRRRGQGSRRDLALAALDELIYEVPQLRLRLTGMPLLAGPTLLAHIEALRAGTYPG
jgi:glyoxylase-like metal-dependent hydrolase (beta-lactamase superfamily II)